MPKRDEAASEGRSLLRTGLEVLKFSQRGKPAVTILKLSSDEAQITWRPHGLIKKRKDKRALPIAGITRVDIGRESAAFRRAPARGQAHLSLSLVLSEAASKEEGRDTLDLCAADEESFGLLVAGLRALVGRPPPIGSPPAALRPSAALGSPPSAPPPVFVPDGGNGSKDEDDEEEDEDSNAPPQTPEAAAAAARRVAELQKRVSELNEAAPAEAAPSDEQPSPVASSFESPDRVSSSPYLNNSDKGKEGTNSAGKEGGTHRKSFGVATGAAATALAAAGVAAAAAANQRRSVQEEDEGTGEEAVEAEAEEGEGEDDDGEVATVAVSIGMDEVLFGDDEDDEAPPEAFDPDTAFASPAKSSTSKSSPAAGKGKQEEEKEAEAAEAEDAANALFRRASFENNIFADSNGDGGDGDGGDAAAAADALFAEDEEEESGVEAKAKAAAVAAVVNPFEVGDEAAQSGTSALDAAADLFDTLDVADPEPAAAPSTNSAAVNNNPFADDDEEDVSPDKAVVASNPFEDVDAMFAAPPKPKQQPPAKVEAVTNPFGDGGDDELQSLSGSEGSGADDMGLSDDEESPEAKAERIMREIDDI